MKLPEASASGTFEKCPPGNHVAVCYEVIDMGTQETSFGEKYQVWIGWETPEEKMEDGRPYVIGKRYTFSMNEKANLRQDLESWRGKPFKDEELGAGGSFEVQNLIGQGCLLNVVHVDKGENTYANIQTVAPLPKGMKSPPLTNDRTFLCLDPSEFDRDTFDGLSDRMKETITKAPEFSALNGKGGTVKMPDIPKADSGTDLADDESPF